MGVNRRHVLLHLGGCLCWPAARSLAAETASVAWQTDFQRAQEMRVAKNRPLLVFVTMDGCPYCHKMMRTTYQEAGVAAEVSETFVLTVVNGSHQQALVRELGVRIFPTTYVIDTQNRLMDRIEGFVPPEQLRRRLSLVARRLASNSSAELE